jgi:hypothetical protein
MVSAEWNPYASFTMAVSTSPSRTVASSAIASSPEIMITGTSNTPATAALSPASGTGTPFSLTDVSRALDIVWARTPSELSVLA